MEDAWVLLSSLSGCAGSPALSQSSSMTLRSSDPVISNLLGLEKCEGPSDVPLHAQVPKLPQVQESHPSRAEAARPGSASPSGQAACGISRAGQK